MRVYKFDIPGPPVGKGRHRSFIRPGMKFAKQYPDPKTVDFESLVKLVAVEAGVEPLERVKVEIICFLPVRMKKYVRKPNEPQEPLQRPDVDNVAKSVTDALNKIAYKDDKHVMGLNVMWNFIAEGKVPYTSVIIEEVDWKDYADCEVVGL